MKPRRVTKGEIVIGRPLSTSIYDDQGQLLLKRGHVIAVNDVPKSIDAIVFEHEPHEIPGWADEYEKAEAMLDQQDSPFELLALLQFRQMSLFKNIATEKDFKSKAMVLAALVEEICKNDEDLALGTIMLDNQGSYSVKHHIHTAIVCNIIAKKLGWSLRERTSLTLAALTMNIGMIELQDVLHNQSDPLTNSQKTELHRHPIVGAEMIRNFGITDELWCTTVAQHHEMVDGSGYPKNLKEGDIIPAARLLSLSDIYCARVSGRDYRPALAPSLAMKEIFLNSKIDTDLGMLFIKHMGIFPPGTFVRLKSNEIAIVTQRGSKVNYPIVHAVIRRTGEVAFVPPRRDTSVAEYAITALIPSENVNITVNRYQLWGYGVFKRSKTLKRKDERVFVSVPAKLLDMQTITTMDAVIINVNESGCMLKMTPEAAGYLTIGTTLHVTFKILTYIVENAAAEVKNIQPKYDTLLIGTMFTEISETDKDNIRTYLKTLDQPAEAQQPLPNPLEQMI
ncbi:HD domain-containing phosphohydrolase [Candidatus Magnetominusculus xianensis]|nr:HD domain-containing phosphohydrolase [Candidatus Magnetominusculus xianensis]MBF0402420.1 HD domain-containing protein [Nitrospirota bacterium]